MMKRISNNFPFGKFVANNHLSINKASSTFLFKHNLFTTFTQQQQGVIISNSTLKRNINTNNSNNYSNNTKDITSFFPYNNNDFASIRRNNLFYIDKTHFIRKLEEINRRLFIVRPPKWGKSLFLSMLYYYYDIKVTQDEFDELFANLWISDKNNWTSKKNQFSKNVKSNNFEQVRNNLQKSIQEGIDEFVDHYDLKNEYLRKSKTNCAFTNLEIICKILEFKKIYNFILLVDGYDDIINNLLLNNVKQYQSITKGKLYDPNVSSLSSFFDYIKNKSMTLYIFGINSIYIDTYASLNISASERGFFGFTENDVKLALNRINIYGNEQELILSIIRKYYSGYCFDNYVENYKLIYNPSQVLYFLQLLLNNDFKKLILQNEIPIHLLMDKNTINYYDKVFKILELKPYSKFIIQELLSKNSFQVMSSIYKHVKLNDIINNDDNYYDEIGNFDNVLGFMYNQGLVSRSLDKSRIKIPNEIIKIEFLKQLQKHLNLKMKIILEFLDNPNELNLKKLLLKIIKKQAEIYDSKMNDFEFKLSIENALKGFIIKYGNIFEIQENIDSKLLLSTKQSIISIEFKRISHRKLIKYCKAWEYTKIRKSLSEINQDELLEMEIESNEKKLVKNFINSTINELNEKKSTTIIENDKKNYNFVVFQIAWPLIIKQL